MVPHLKVAIIKHIACVANCKHGINAARERCCMTNDACILYDNCVCSRYAVKRAAAFLGISGSRRMG